MAHGVRMHGRLASLERKHSRAKPSTCPECRGPVPGQNSYVLVNKARQPWWGVCQTCGLALDKHGKACCPYALKKGEARGHCKVYGPGMAELIDRI